MPRFTPTLLKLASSPSYGNRLPLNSRVCIRHMSTDPTQKTKRDTVHPAELPEMQLSKSNNPLTAPTTDLKDIPISERAAKRFSVKGNAIVTGGAGFIGLASARSLLEHGASGISLFDMESSFEMRKAEVDQLKADYPDAAILTQHVDVTDFEGISTSVSEAARQLGSIDHMLCFAGIVATIPATDMTPENWRKVLDINVSGSWYCAQAACRKMREQKSGGSILFTASISAHQVNFPQPQVSYNVSKSAILQLTRSLAAEWAQYGIRVNSLSPGYMDTVLTMLNDGKGLEVGKEIWENRNPMGRMGTPQELTGAVVLLASEVGGRYITGEDIQVDGGQTVF